VWLEAALGNDRPGVLNRGIDGEPDTPATKTFSPVRSTVTLSATTPAPVGVDLICAEVEVADPEHGESSSTLAFVFRRLPRRGRRIPA
jgi:hypothetical protein